jgi:hypothetical protein
MSAAVVESAREGPRPSAPSRAAALLSLLDEPRAELRAHALSALSAIVDVEWSAVASSVATIEALYEDEEFGARLDAAMLASKVRTRGARATVKASFDGFGGLGDLVGWITISTTRLVEGDERNRVCRRRRRERNRR